MRLDLARLSRAILLLVLMPLALVGLFAGVAMADDNDLIADALKSLLGAYAPYAVAAVLLAKVLCACTVAPAPTSIWAWPYFAIEKLALIFGRMKQAFVLILVLPLLAACALSGDPKADAAKAEGYLVAFQPVESTLACDAQQLANATTLGLEASGDVEAALASSAASKVSGTFCNNLPAGAPLPTPVATAGTTTLPTSSGTITVPTPVGTVPAK